MNARVLLFGAILMAVAGPAQGRVCGRWNAAFTSDSGRVAALRIVIRKCGGGISDKVPICSGRYRCDGDACPSRRGRFASEESHEVPFAGVWTLLHADVSPLRTRVHPACAIQPVGSIGPPYRYLCYAPGPTPRPIVDQGTFRCQTEAACRSFGCS